MGFSNRSGLPFLASPKIMFLFYTTLKWMMFFFVQYHYLWNLQVVGGDTKLYFYTFTS